MKKLLLSTLFLVPLYTSAMLTRLAPHRRSSSLLTGIGRMSNCQSKRLFTEETDPTETKISCLKKHENAIELLETSEAMVRKSNINPQEIEELWKNLHQSKKNMADVSTKAEQRIATVCEQLRIRQDSNRTRSLEARVERLENLCEPLLEKYLTELIEDSDR